VKKLGSPEPVFPSPTAPGRPPAGDPAGAGAARRDVKLGSPRLRAGLTLGDQGLSSLSNFVLGLVVAAHVPLADYGRFAVVYSFYGITLGVCRALCSEPLMVRFSSQDGSRQRSHGGKALGAAVAFGAAFGAVCVVVSAVAGGTLGSTGLALGIGLPFLFLQDGYRFLGFVLSRPHEAVLADSVWNAGFVALLVWVPGLASATTPAPFLAAWVVAATASMLVAGVRMATAPRLGQGWSWFQAHPDLGPRFAAEFLVNSAGTHVIIYAATVLAGFEVAGALRGGYVLMGPLWIVAAGMTAAAVPEGVRLWAAAPQRFRWAILALTAALIAVAVVWGLVTIHLPDNLGRALLGDAWPRVQPLMTGLTVFGAGFVATTGLVAGLRVLGEARRSFIATVPTGLLVIVGGSVGVAVAGEQGAVIGTILPVWTGAVLVAWQFRRALADRAAPR
jgi:O-antigen/teichoic acid export membrane protein